MGKKPRTDTQARTDMAEWVQTMPRWIQNVM